MLLQAISRPSFSARRWCALLLFSVVLGCADSPSGLRSPGIHIVSGTSVTDTITAYVAQPLEVVVSDADGRPAPDMLVIFEARSPGATESNPWPTPFGFGRGDAVQFLRAFYDTTDASGHASAWVRLGTATGTGVVLVRVPELGYVDSVVCTVTPGGASRVIVSPADTVIYPGQVYPLVAHVLDRAGNERTIDHATFSLASGLATLSNTGTITSSSYGRVAVTAQMGAVSGTAMLSVVPHAQVAVQHHDPWNRPSLGIFLMQLDGSGRQRIADPATEQGFGWAPDGSELVITRGDSLDVITPGAAERRLLQLPGPATPDARYSRDGTWIYFARPTVGMYRVQRDGTGLQHLGLGGTEWGEDYRPSPSPDGASVVYGSIRSPCGQEQCIRVLDIATNADRIYSGQTFLMRGSQATWSPTTDLIAFVSSAGLGLVRADGTGQTILASDIRAVASMSWSPDGRWLLVSPVGGTATLFDTQSDMRLPLPTLAEYVGASWRP